MSISISLTRTTHLLVLIPALVRYQRPGATKRGSLRYRLRILKTKQSLMATLRRSLGSVSPDQKAMGRQCQWGHAGIRYSRTLRFLVDQDLQRYDEVLAIAGTLNDGFSAKPNVMVRVEGGMITDSKDGWCGGTSLRAGQRRLEKSRFE